MPTEYLPNMHPYARRTRRFHMLFAAVMLTMGTLLAFVPAPASRAQSGLLPLAEFPQTTLEIRSRGEKHVFAVWVATTPQQQSQGLMFVRDLPADRGMLFTASEPRVFTMWMKNTYIPLDMVFIGADGRIAKIAARTTPHSLDLVSSGKPVLATLELKGGEAARRSLRVGDEVSWSAPHG